MIKYDLFKKNIKPKCKYCKNSTIKETLFCKLIKKNVDSNNMCKFFNYCPLKRIPNKKIKKFNFTKEDFKI